MRLPSSCAMAALCLLSPARLAAQEGPGDLLVSPTRVVFEGRQRSAELNLSNGGETPGTYRIALVRMEMDEEGGLKEVPFTAESESLKALFRFSPRQVTLGPHESQTVRIQVQKPAELPAGEYRLHLLLTALPPAALPAGSSPGSPKGLTIRLIPVFGVAVPMILRQGEPNAQAALRDPALDPARRTLSFSVERSGIHSLYGDFTVRLLSGGASVLAEMKGVAVYVPNTVRRMELPLAPTPPLVPGTRIRIAYSRPDSEGGALLAETVVTVP